jgi:hypothetical protein
MSSLGVDVQPTSVQLDALRNAQAHAAKAMAQWSALEAQLKRAGMSSGSIE